MIKMRILPIDKEFDNSVELFEGVDLIDPESFEDGQSISVLDELSVDNFLTDLNIPSFSQGKVENTLCRLKPWVRWT